jgi:hypothetical protein
MEDASGVGYEGDDDFRLWRDTFKSIRKGQIKPVLHTPKEPDFKDFTPQGAKACMMINGIRKENAYLQQKMPEVV